MRFLILFLILAAQGWGATHTIGPGKTYETFAALIAAETLVAGDVVDGGGNTFAETWTVPASGAAGNVITLKNATITGGINGNAKDYIRVTAIRASRPVILSGAHNQLDYLISENAVGNGVTISGASNVIYNAVIYGASGKGIDAQESCEVKNSIIRNTNEGNLHIAVGKTVTGASNLFEDPAPVGDGTYTDSGDPWASSTPIMRKYFDANKNTPWEMEYPEYRDNLIGFNYNTSQSVAFADDFTQDDGTPEGWTAVRGTFAVSGNALTTTSTAYTMIVPTADYSTWTDYRLSLKVTRLGASDAPGYAMIYLRSAISGTADTGFVLLYRQTGKLDVYGRNAGAFTSAIVSANVSKDNAQHSLIITVVGPALKIWIDKDESYYPDISIALDVDPGAATAGTIGIGTNSWHSVFDDIVVTPIIQAAPTPPYNYGATDIKLKTLETSPFTDALSVSILTPNGSTYTVTNPSGLSGTSSGTIAFPAAFTGLPVDHGIYRITVTNGDDTSHTYMEVRERPLVSFIQIADAHTGVATATKPLGWAIEDILAERYFPLPDFVVDTGDSTELGTIAQIAEVKAFYDQLTIPYYAIMAGHDYLSEAGEARGDNWASVFGEAQTTQSWVIGNYVFFKLNDGWNGTSMTTVTDDNVAFVTNLIANHPDKYIIAFYHITSYACRDAGGALGVCGAPATAAVWHNLLKSHNGALALFGGHSHVNATEIVDGILYQATTSLYNNRQYRHVAIYADRVESLLATVDREYSPADAGRLWAGATDSKHTDALYSFGLPHERSWRFDIASRTLSLDYHALPTSPAINAGVDVGLTTDIEGKAIRGLPDIGAYEFAPATTNTILNRILFKRPIR